jgi:hypothetical protein
VPVLAQVESNQFGLTAAFHRCETLRMTDDADEDLSMRATVIGSEHCDDDYQVIWRGMSIGRIRRDQPQWSWSCYLQGRPTSAIDNGTGLDACKAKFKAAWARICASLTDQDITTTRRYAANRGTALARYDARAAR